MYTKNLIKSVRPSHGGLEYAIVTNQGSYNVTAADFRKIGEDVLFEGNVIDEELAFELELATAKLACIQKSLKFLEYGDMPEKKLRMKLATNKKVKFSKEAVDDAIDILKENGYIDDERLARELCEEYFFNCKMSPKMIKAKLFQKGFDSQTINFLFEDFEFDEETLFENMKSLVSEKFGELSECDECQATKEKIRETKIKALEYLVRKGYSYEEAKSVINNLY